MTHLRIIDVLLVVYRDVDGTFRTYFTYTVSMCQKLLMNWKRHGRKQSWPALWRHIFIRFLGLKKTSRDQSG